MDALPDNLLIDIFHLIDSTTDLARVRLVSKRLCSVSYNVQSISLIVSKDRLSLQLRHPESILPLKSLLKNLVSLFNHRYLDSLSVEFDSDCECECDNDGNSLDGRDDFFLMDREYFASLLNGEIASRLISLLVSNFAPHSRRRKTAILEFLFTNCTNLLNLELRNGWLCVKNLKPMLTLQRLTLECIKLDDNDLDKINECLPFLYDLGLYWVNGLNNPKIQHQTLKACFLHNIDFAFSITVCAPLLNNLHIESDKQRRVILKTPELRRLGIKVWRQHIEFDEFGRFLFLRKLCLEAPAIGRLLHIFSGLTADLLKLEAGPVIDASPEHLIRSFPAAATLRIGPRVFSELQRSFLNGCLSFDSLSQSLTTLILYLSEKEFEFSVLCVMVLACPLLSEVVFIFPSGTPSDVMDNFTSNFAIKYRRIKCSSLQQVRDTEGPS